MYIGDEKTKVRWVSEGESWLKHSKKNEMEYRVEVEEI